MFLNKSIYLLNYFPLICIKKTNQFKKSNKILNEFILIPEERDGDIPIINSDNLYNFTCLLRINSF